MTGVFLQVRLGSTRLPRKALARIAGRRLIERAMAALRRVPSAVHAVLTDQMSEPELGPIAADAGYLVFAGSPDNVLDRYVRASEQFGVSEIIRATGDNPAVSPLLACLAARERRRLDADYFAFDGLPLGTGVEVVKASALQIALRETDSEYDREHVCPFLYNNPSRFRCVRHSAAPAFCHFQGRVTVDTKDDLDQTNALFEELAEEDSYSPDDVLPLHRLVRHVRQTA